jgi:DNA-binding NarL/FixJ family response regulator
MQLHKCRILLVDDHAPMREAVRDLLSSYDDLDVIGEASDGRMAVHMVEACRPDVVLMDINMPKMNGIEAAKLIKHSWGETVIIGVCAVRDPYITDTFMRAGALAVVSKDRLANLHATIQRACVARTGDAFSKAGEVGNARD